MPIRLCNQPQCPEPAAYRGRCQRHAKQREQATHPNKTLYNSTRWQLLRRRVLFNQPLCGCGAIATDVDHIRAVEDGGQEWALANLQGLCAACHSRKTNQELRSR